jgi:drug/metabolite transporter (DMT)-like permease
MNLLIASKLSASRYVSQLWSTSGDHVHFSRTSAFITGIVLIVLSPVLYAVFIPFINRLYPRSKEKWPGLMTFQRVIAPIFVAICGVVLLVDGVSH